MFISANLTMLNPSLNMSSVGLFRMSISRRTTPKLYTTAAVNTSQPPAYSIGGIEEDFSSDTSFKVGNKDTEPHKTR
jgi:hypothetical protein